MSVTVQQVALILRNLRMHLEYSQEYVQINTGINICRVENGETNIRIDTFFALLSFYNITLEDFGKCYTETSNTPALNCNSKTS